MAKENPAGWLGWSAWEARWSAREVWRVLAFPLRQRRIRYTNLHRSGEGSEAQFLAAHSQASFCAIDEIIFGVDVELLARAELKQERGTTLRGQD